MASAKERAGLFRVRLPRERERKRAGFILVLFLAEEAVRASVMETTRLRLAAAAASAAAAAQPVIQPSTLFLSGLGEPPEDVDSERSEGLEGFCGRAGACFIVLAEFCSSTARTAALFSDCGSVAFLRPHQQPPAATPPPGTVRPAVIGSGWAVVCDGIAVVCDGTAVVCDGMAVVCDRMAVVGNGRAVVGDGMAVVGDGTADICGGTAVVCSCLLYTSPSPRDVHKSRIPSSA